MSQLLSHGVSFQLSPSSSTATMPNGQRIKLTWASGVLRIPGTFYTSLSATITHPWLYLHSIFHTQPSRIKNTIALLADMAAPQHCPGTFLCEHCLTSGIKRQPSPKRQRDQSGHRQQYQRKTVRFHTETTHHPGQPTIVGSTARSPQSLHWTHVKPFQTVFVDIKSLAAGTQYTGNVRHLLIFYDLHSALMTAVPHSNHSQI